MGDAGGTYKNIYFQQQKAALHCDYYDHLLLHEAWQYK